MIVVTPDGIELQESQILNGTIVLPTAIKAVAMHLRREQVVVTDADIASYLNRYRGVLAPVTVEQVGMRMERLVNTGELRFIPVEDGWRRTNMTGWKKWKQGVKK